MAIFRGTIPDFQLANPLYIGAQVSFFTVSGGVATTTLATLYAAPTGATTMANPQTLDSEGKFVAPVYIEEPVIASVVGATVGSHTTGVIGLSPDTGSVNTVVGGVPQNGIAIFADTSGYLLKGIAGVTIGDDGSITTPFLTTAAGATGIKFNQYGLGLLHSSAAGVLSSAAVSLTADISGVLAGVNGGTGLSTAAIGDIIYASAITPTWARLAGNITTTKKYLSQTGSGAASAAPAWAQIAQADISGLTTADTPSFAGLTLTGTLSSTTSGMTEGLSFAQTTGDGLDWTAGFLFPWKFSHTHTATAGTGLGPTTFVSAGVLSAINYGYGGVAALGTAAAFSASYNVFGNGNALNEHTPVIFNLNCQIGTGFTQTAGPTGRLWLSDRNLHGPIGVQPDLMIGPSIFVNNYYNGSPGTALSSALVISTGKGLGGGNDATHVAANTYPFDSALTIVGDSNAGSPANGFNAGITIGGIAARGPWGENASRIGIGVKFGGTITDSCIDTTGATVTNYQFKGTGFTVNADGTALTLGGRNFAVTTGTATTYNNLYDSAGNLAFSAGGGGVTPDARNYINNTETRIGNIGGGVVFAQFATGTTGIKFNQYGFGLLQSSAAGVLSSTSTPTLGVASTTLGTLAFATAAGAGIGTLQYVGGAGSATLSLPATTTTLSGLAVAETHTGLKTFSPAGTVAATFKTTGGAGSFIIIDNSAASQQSGFNLYDNAVPIWQVIKHTTQSLLIYDAVNGVVMATFTPGAVGAGYLTFANTLDASSSTVAAARFAGGLAVAKAIALGTNLWHPTIANGSVATALSSVGPVGSNTTVQEWFPIKNAAGTIRYVPGF